MRAKQRQSSRHKGKRAAATLRRNTRANQRAIKRAKRVEYFKANPDKGSPSQVALRPWVARMKARRKRKQGSK